MTAPKYDAAWNSFQSLREKYTPWEAAQMMRDLSAPEEVIAECIRRHETEIVRIVELEEPLRTGRENTKHWYTGPKPSDKNWPAFKRQLERSLDPEAVKKIDEASDVVVSMLDHPATNGFRSFGLVVGHVQSGKTSNFTAVITKAADRGYRIFIVLSGIHNALRRQTQTRLIRDVVQLNAPLWHQITKAEHDFTPIENPASLLSSKDQTLLLVVKKNAPVLRKLRKWLNEARPLLANCPTLIIDDEADQATVATKTINPLIADVIERFPKVCYVGYTATPFANLLIDPADEDGFYPRDFILSLPRGADYQGAEELFGRNPVDGEDPEDAPGGLDMIREIPADELIDLRPARRADVPTFEPTMTPSLRQACLWFWMATAIRHARGQAHAHSSMLIHAHSDVRVHDSFRAPLVALRQEIADGLRSGSPDVCDEMQRLWDTEIRRVARPLDAAEVAFESAMAQLAGIVTGTKIIMDHYRSTDRLDYSGEPSAVIAVGGNTLSRGLTLEGLIVSFFVRSADVYDTLLQMGRWFGYRPGYADLPRIYMPDEMRAWFTHLATVEAEMRDEIDRYLAEHKTPRELAVRIKCHPKMRITAPAKEGSMIKASAAFGGELVESRYFPTRPPDDALRWHQRNERAVRRLIHAAERHTAADAGVSNGRVLWREVPVDHVQEFVGDYRFHDRGTDASNDLMARYIARRVEQGGLHHWNIGVVGNAAGRGRKPVALPSGHTVGAVSRTRLMSNENDAVADIKTLTGSRDPALDLTLLPGTPVTRTHLNDLRIEQQPETGLVLLYPIDSQSMPTRSDRRPLDAPGEVVWGAALVFPKPTGGVDLAVEYDYVSADLSRVYAAAQEDDETDASVLEDDLDAESTGS